LPTRWRAGPDGKPVFLSNQAGGFWVAYRRPADRGAFFGEADLVHPNPRKTIDVKGHETEIATKGRHDPCVGIRAVPIAKR